MVWKQVFWFLLVVLMLIVPITVFTMTHVQLSMAPGKTQIDELQSLIHQLQEKTSTSMAESKARDKRLEKLADMVAGLSKQAMPTDQKDLMGKKVETAGQGVDALLQSRIAAIEKELTRQADKMATLDTQHQQDLQGLADAVRLQGEALEQVKSILQQPAHSLNPQQQALLSKGELPYDEDPVAVSVKKELASSPETTRQPSVALPAEPATQPRKASTPVTKKSSAMGEHQRSSDGPAAQPSKASNAGNVSALKPATQQSKPSTPGNVEASIASNVSALNPATQHSKPSSRGNVTPSKPLVPSTSLANSSIGAALALKPQPTEQLPDGKCPPKFPFPYKADDLGIPNHCCNVSVNCHGNPISTKDYECCGGDDVGMPITYRYKEQKPVDCQSFPWWGLLSNTVEGPLWLHMKKAAESTRRKQEEELASKGVQSTNSTQKPFTAWSGANDTRLKDAGAKEARDYVASTWGRSGWRQFETARKFLDLQPGHGFLEIGCGAMNAGQFFLHFLQADRYVCVEPNSVLHVKSAEALPSLQHNMSAKRPQMVTRDDFDPRPAIKPGRFFNRTWSHSVLSHSADWQLMQYFEVMAAVLEPSSGVGMASIRFSLGNGEAEWASHEASWVYPSVSYYDFGEARCMAKRVGLELELLPEARLFMTEVVPNEYHDWIRMKRIKRSSEVKKKS